MLHIERETSLHLTYCEGFGISRGEMENTEEQMACTAYTRSIILHFGIEASATLALLISRADTYWTSDSPRTGLACNLPLHRVYSATAPWQKCCMATRGRRERTIVTGPGSRTTWRMTMCRQSRRALVRPSCLPLSCFMHRVMADKSSDVELLERNAALQSASRIEELVKIFIHATKVSRAARGHLAAEIES